MQRHRSTYQVDEQAPPTVNRENRLAKEVDRLRYEVERSREEQVSRGQAQQAALQPRSSVDEVTSSTVLVFRDGHRSAIQNYAIVGQTVWVFTERRARKILVSDLDVEVTKEVNADRGLEFRIHNGDSVDAQDVPVAPLLCGGTTDMAAPMRVAT
jgi:hypothetical protein